MIKAIFQDVDGCLNPANGEDFGVEEGWQPSADQIAMLTSISAALDASPVEHFIINTGRFWPILESIFAHVTTPKLRYFVMEHACVIYDRKTDTTLHLPSLARGLGLEQLAACYENLAIMPKLLLWYETVGQKAMEIRYATSMLRLNKEANLSFAIPKGVEGDVVLQEIESLAKQDFSEEELRQLDFSRSDRFVDILPGIHKMDGIELMCAYLKIDQIEALAVGDYLNDLSVFEAFDQVLCPANAHPRIRELTRSKGGGGIVSDHFYGESLVKFLQGGTLERLAGRVLCGT